MFYDVTYQIDGQERTDQIDAADAARAAELVRSAHEGTAERFELILVHLVEDGTASLLIEAEASPS